MYLLGGLEPVYKWKFTKFLVDFQELESLEIMSLDWILGFRFSKGYDIVMPYGFLAGFWETKTHSKTHGGYHVLTFGLGHDTVLVR